MQSKGKGGGFLKMCLLFFFLSLLLGILSWLFVFRGQEVSRGKSVKSEVRFSGISSEASPEIQDAALEKKGEIDVAVKNKQESTSVQPVVHSPALSKLESIKQEITEGKIIEALVDQSAQALPERTAAGNQAEKELLEMIGAYPENVSENDRKQQGQNEEGLFERVPEGVGTALARGYEEKEEQELPASDIVGDGKELAVEDVSEVGSVDFSDDRAKRTVKDSATAERMLEEEKLADGLSVVEAVSGSTQLIPAVLTETARRDVVQKKINSVNSGELSEEITSLDDQKISLDVSRKEHGRLYPSYREQRRYALGNF